MLSIHEVLQRRYRIVRLIGNGSIGAVYEAVDESFGEPVAIKEVRYELTDSIDRNQLELLRNAFKREAKSLARARHPAVPYVRDYFLDRERQYLVMDMVGGDDLGSILLDRGTPFSVDEVLDWTDQLLDALDHLHNLVPSVVHGDIKPKNIKLVSEGKLKLLDLGIAKTVDDAAFTVTPSELDFTALNYLSFEQVLHVIDPTFRDFILEKHRNRAVRVLDQSCDARSDLYMLGATIFYLLTNRPATDIVKRTIDTWEGNPDPLPDPSELNPEIPPTFSKCILRALAIDREDRFASASAMRGALNEAIGRSAPQISKECPAPAANGNGHLNGKSFIAAGPGADAPANEIVNAVAASPLPSGLSSAAALVTAPLPPLSLTTSRLPVAAAEELSELRKIESLAVSEPAPEIGRVDEEKDAFEIAPESQPIQEMEVGNLLDSPSLLELERVEFPPLDAGVGARSESIPESLEWPGTESDANASDLLANTLVSEPLTLARDEKPDTVKTPERLVRKARSNGHKKSSVRENKYKFADVTKAIGKVSSRIPEIPLWLSLTAVAVVLTIAGIAVLVWLLSLGRPTGDISVVNASPRRPDTAPPRVIEPQTAESGKLQEPAPRAQAVQPVSDPGPGPASEAPVLNAASREKQKGSEPQVKAHKPAAEQQTNSTAQPADGPSSTKPKQEKKKITVDDLINDN